jgi:hypothetical protein
MKRRGETLHKFLQLDLRQAINERYVEAKIKNELHEAGSIVINGYKNEN